MNPISNVYNWQRITPDDAHYYFGYYDRNPWNADQTLHLMLRIDQCERLPLPGEKAEIGVVTPNGGWRKITETRAKTAILIILIRKKIKFIYSKQKILKLLCIIGSITHVVSKAF